MLKSVKALVDAGFAVHLLRPHSKIPLNEGWTTAPVLTYSGLKRAYSDGLNVGVRLGKPSRVDGLYLHIVDFDIRDEDLADEAREALANLFPGVRLHRFPTVKSGSGGSSRHYYFLTEDPFRTKKLAHSDEFVWVWDESKGREVKRWKWEIELLGTGKQAVIPPSIHPDTGKPYEWLVEPDFEIGIPTIDAEHLFDLTDEDEDFEHDNADPLGITIEDAEDALAEIEDWADDRETWVRVGMALKHEFGDDGWDLFDRWSKRGHGYDRRENWQQWRSFKLNRDKLYTMRSIMAEANERVEERSIQSMIADMDDAKDIIRETLETHAEDLPKIGVPKHLLSIPGVLQGMVDYYNAKCPVEQPQFAVQAALAVGSIVLARNFCTDYSPPNYSSLYLMCIGETGSGKETVKSAVKEVLVEADLAHLRGFRDYTSESGVVDALSHKPRHISLIDELGKRLGNVRNAQSGIQDAAYTTFVELFSTLDSEYYGSGFSEQNKSKDTIEANRNRVIIRPGLSLVGLTQPATFYNAVGMSDVSSGFLNRFLIVQSVTDAIQEQRMSFEAPVIPDSLVRWMRKMAWAMSADEEDTGNVADLAYPGDPVVIPFSDDARELLGKINREWVSLKRKYHAHGLLDMISRVKEIAQRVSLIVAVSDRSKQIRAHHLQWAWDYVKFYTEQTAVTFMERAGRTEWQDIADLMAEKVKEAGPEGISAPALKWTSRYKKLPAREKAEVENFLKDDHGIVPIKKGTGGRAKIIYRHPIFNVKGAK